MIYYIASTGLSYRNARMRLEVVSKTTNKTGGRRMVARASEVSGLFSHFKSKFWAGFWADSMKYHLVQLRWKFQADICSEIPRNELFWSAIFSSQNKGAVGWIFSMKIHRTFRFFLMKTFKYLVYNLSESFKSNYALKLEIFNFFDIGSFQLKTGRLLR